MPRRQRKSKRGAGASIGRFMMKLGAVFPGQQEPTDRHWRLAWERHREGLIEEYRERWPGERPWAFWHFDAGVVHPATRAAELEWLLEHRHIDRREGDAILAEEQRLLESGYGDHDPHGTLEEPRERADLIRAARKRKRGRR